MIRLITGGQPQRTLRVEGTDPYAGDGLVYCPVDSATVIEIGDLLYLDGDDAKPASSQADAGTEAANQGAFQDLFLGIAAGGSRAGQTADIPVFTKGIFEADCPSSTFEIGVLVGASENAAGDGLLNQQVEGVTTADLAIGRVVRRVASADTRVVFDLVSTVVYGGAQPVAVAKGAALTAQLTSITHTAPSTPDYALQDLTDTGGFGFATKDEGNTVLSVILNLQVRLAQVEARLEAAGIVTPN